LEGQSADRHTGTAGVMVEAEVKLGGVGDGQFEPWLKHPADDVFRFTRMAAVKLVMQRRVARVGAGSARQTLRAGRHFHHPFPQPRGGSATLVENKPF
jgi:hypothetical protein